MNDPIIPSRELSGSRMVLVVDDVRAVRQLTARLLSEEGYRVFEAANVVEALEVLDLSRGRIDVMLVDVVMPDVSGVDLVRMVRERWPEQTIVFMSAFPAEVLAREGLQDLNVLFLAKPFTRTDLVSKIEQALERPRLRNGEVRRAEPSGEQ